MSESYLDDLSDYFDLHGDRVRTSSFLTRFEIPSEKRVEVVSLRDAKGGLIDECKQVYCNYVKLTNSIWALKFLELVT